MKKLNTKRTCSVALFIAIQFVATAYIAFAIPLGYANLGGCILLFAGYLFGWKAGFMIGGIGSAMADLALGYTLWAPFTLIIKGFAGLAAGSGKQEHGRKLTAGIVMKAIFAMIIVVVGYVIGGAIIELIGGASLEVAVTAGVWSAPALCIEAVVNLVVFVLLVLASKATGLERLVRKMD